MCLSQMHAGARQCIVNTFFFLHSLRSIFAPATLFFFFQIHIHSFFSATFQTEPSLHPVPARIVASVNHQEHAGFPHHRPAGNLKGIYNFGGKQNKTKQLLQCFPWSQPLLPQTWSQFLKLLSKLQKIPLQRGRAGKDAAGCGACKLQEKACRLQQHTASF